jgi:RNA polymerase sigma-70 factor (ECF subfamily)
VYKYLNDWESSREIVQSTFLKVWENKNRISVNTSAQSYLYRAVKNTMIDFIRKEKKKKEYLESVGGLSEAILVHSENEIKPYIIRQEILKAMQTLKPKNRKIFELHKFEGLTYKEIANFLEVSERAVEDNIARALKQLRTELIDKIDMYD